jgi:hypothetical protein
MFDRLSEELAAVRNKVAHNRPVMNSDVSLLSEIADRFHLEQERPSERRPARSSSAWRRERKVARGG